MPGWPAISALGISTAKKAVLATEDDDGRTVGQVPGSCAPGSSASWRCVGCRVAWARALCNSTRTSRRRWSLARGPKVNSKPTLPIPMFPDAGSLSPGLRPRPIRVNPARVNGEAPLALPGPNQTLAGHGSHQTSGMASPTAAPRRPWRMPSWHCPGDHPGPEGRRCKIGIFLRAPVTECL